MGSIGRFVITLGIAAALVSACTAAEAREWAPTASGTQADILDITGTGASDVFAVGDFGTVLHYDGAAWSTVRRSRRGPHLRAVWGSSPNNVFVVGDYGLILHYDGTAWSARDSVTENHLRGVWGSGPSDIFVTGWNGTVLHYDGEDWSVMRSGSKANLYGIWGSGARDVFVVGDQGVILRGVCGSGLHRVLAVGRGGEALCYNRANAAPSE